VREAGGKAMTLSLPNTPLMHGAALRREWIADQAQVACIDYEPSALLLHRGHRKGEGELAGLVLAAMRLNLPAVLTAPHHTALAVALAAAGFAPLSGERDALASPRVAVEMVNSGGPRPKDLLNGFSLANALRAGLAAGGGPELLVHLAALAREAGEVGFSRMIRVLAPESPALAGSRTIAGLFAALGDALHDTRTVEGKMLKESLPEPSAQAPAEKCRLRFVVGRTSGVEAVASAPPAAEEVAGACRVCGSEGEAIEAVAGGHVKEGDLLVVVGCGVRGGPGLLGLSSLDEALIAANLDVPVVTDGLPPQDPSRASSWVSLFAPEAADGGVIGRLRDGDFLRFDLAEGRIRTSVTADELANREPFAKRDQPRFGYAARYAACALPALEGAGFG
jgi:dihydroxy-acid dehydratase